MSVSLRTLAMRAAALVLFLIAAWRAAVYATVAWHTFGDPTDAFFLESQMVHLSWRVQASQPFYPDWRTGPWVANVFGPVYFWIVGTLGRVLDCDLDGLRRMGRAVTLLACCGSAALVAAAVRTGGRLAMATAAAVTLGSPLAIGFGITARSDALAEFLGLAGFLSALAPRWAALGGIVLAFAALTRQPNGIFLIAALAALSANADRRRAGTVLATFAATAAALLGVLYFAGERYAIPSMLLESGSPWSWEQWRIIALRSLTRGFDVWLLVLAALWNFRRTPWLAALAFFPTVAGLILCAKYGSDVNYLTPMRLAAGIAAGQLTAALWQANARWTAPVGAFAVAAAVGFVGALWLNALAPLTDPGFRELKRRYAQECLAAARLAPPTGALLSNVGEVQLYLRERALFVDPFLFKMMANDGRIDPRNLIDKLNRREIVWVVLSTDLDDPNYDANPFGLPRRVADAVREHYEPAGGGFLQLYKARPR